MKRRPEPKWGTKGACGYGFEQAEFGYWLGDCRALDTNVHVELVELRSGTLEALNPTFQNRIETWLQRIDDWRLHIVTLGRREFFINIEPYAV